MKKGVSGIITFFWKEMGKVKGGKVVNCTMVKVRTGRLKVVY